MGVAKKVSFENSTLYQHVYQLFMMHILMNETPKFLFDGHTAHHYTSFLGLLCAHLFYGGWQGDNWSLWFFILIVFDWCETLWQGNQTFSHFENAYIVNT